MILQRYDDDPGGGRDVFHGGEPGGAAQRREAGAGLHVQPELRLQMLRREQRDPLQPGQRRLLRL